jgi:glycosyltransferase involved in cell wall biosynthesis
LAAKLLKVIDQPILFHDHYGDIEIDTQVPAWFRYWGASHVDYYVGVSDELVNWAMDAGIPRQRTSMIANALDTQRFAAFPGLNLRDKFNIPAEQKIGIMVGNLRTVKGLDLLISACTEIPKEILPAFFIVGEAQEPDYVRNCLNQIHNKALEKNFHFVGQQPDSLSWMMGADFAVLPSRSESGPLVLIEVMACGLPFVAFNVGGISHTVSQYMPDQFAAPNDCRRFAGKLEALARTAKERMKEQGQEARKLSFELFDIQHKMPLWRSLYQKIVRNER